MLPTCPENCVYTPFYCEENIYKLVESLDEKTRKSCYVVFISNHEQRTPLWKQRIGRSSEDHIVFWDYHVILIHCPSIDPSKPNLLSNITNRETKPPSEPSIQKAYVYDFDTVLPFPVEFPRYYESVFRPGTLKTEYSQLFRVIYAPEYLANFSSDRSRMKHPDGSFIEPPPKYSCIQNGNSFNNLNDFISMNNDFHCGTVLSLNELYDLFVLK